MKDNTKSEENVPGLEVVELSLVQCNLVDNQYQQKFEVLHTFRHNKYQVILCFEKPITLHLLIFL